MAVFYQAHINGQMKKAEDYLDQRQLEALAQEVLNGKPTNVGFWGQVRSGGYFFRLPDLFQNSLIMDSENADLEQAALDAARTRAVNWALKMQSQSAKAA